MDSIIGLAMFYSWGHAIFIHYKAPTDRTTYEKVVSIIAMVAFGLFVIGAL